MQKGSAATEVDNIPPLSSSLSTRSGSGAGSGAPSSGPGAVHVGWGWIVGMIFAPLWSPTSDSSLLSTMTSGPQTLLQVPLAQLPYQFIPQSRAEDALCRGCFWCRDWAPSSPPCSLAHHPGSSQLHFQTWLKPADHAAAASAHQEGFALAMQLVLLTGALLSEI